MTFPVLVEPCGRQFAATLAGAPDVRSVASTRGEAVAALKSQLAERIAQGDLFSVEVAEAGVTSLAGRYADDPWLAELCADVYRQRDAEAHG